MGFLIKIDTNGTNPKTIENLIKSNLVDYIALDYKAPKNKFLKVTGTELFEPFNETLSIICNSKVNFEIRSTIHTNLLNENNINTIIKDLENKKFNKNFYLQNFINNGTTLANLPKQSKKLDLSKITSLFSFVVLIACPNLTTFQLSSLVFSSS